MVDDTLFTDPSAGRAFTISPPGYVGGYKIGKDPYSIIFNLTNKPNWFHRQMMKLCLGWVWVDDD
jgi:hypothetical protein